jgi:hypothetical protein
VTIQTEATAVEIPRPAPAATHADAIKRISKKFRQIKFAAMGVSTNELKEVERGVEEIERLIAETRALL